MENFENILNDMYTNYKFEINSDINNYDFILYIVKCKTKSNDLLNKFLFNIDCYYIVDDTNYLVFKNLTNIEIDYFMKVINYFYKKLEHTDINYKIYQIKAVKEKTLVKD